jgi:arylsulfatase A-like enzyme
MQTHTPTGVALGGRIHLVVTHLLIAICCGILTGFVELAILWSREAVFGRLIFASRHALWMTPLAYAILFDILGLALGAAAMIAPRRVTLRVGLFFCVTFGGFCLFLPFPQIHRLAALLLAIGVAVQATRMLTAPGRQPAALVRRVTPWLLAAVLLAAVGTLGWAAVRERRAFSGLPAADPAAPNVLLIIWDTARAASMSLYGHHHATTPTLERLARDGVVFEWAIATSPWTLPSHGTMFTGRFPHELSTDWFRPLDDTFPTIAEVFREQGYATGGFTANVHYTGYRTGLDRGFRIYRDYHLVRAFLWSTQLLSSRVVYDLRASRSLGEVVAALRAFQWTVGLPGSDAKHAGEVNGEFLGWRATIGQRPYFAFLNYMDAHAPYWSRPSDLARFTEGTDLETHYDAALAYLDDQVGDVLGRLGELDNTIVIIASDHGELFGEHGLYLHAQSLDFRVLHVPLVLLLPGRTAAGLRVAEPVSLGDLPATMLELAGLAEASRFPGTSLSRYWDGSGATAGALLSEVRQGHHTPDSVPISRGPMKSLVGRGMHYILNGDGEEELYDYEADDAETTNLLKTADKAEVGPVVAWFREELKRAPRPRESLDLGLSGNRQEGESGRKTARAAIGNQMPPLAREQSGHEAVGPGGWHGEIGLAHASDYPPRKPRQYSGREQIGVEVGELLNVEAGLVE